MGTIGNKLSSKTKPPKTTGQGSNKIGQTTVSLESLTPEEMAVNLKSLNKDQYQKTPSNFMKNHVKRNVVAAPMRNWDKLGWKGTDSATNLTATEQSHWKALGWDAKSWAGKTDPPNSSKMSWNALVKKGLSKHAEALGYSKQSWDKEKVAGAGELAAQVGKKAGLNTSQKEQLRVALRTVDASLLKGANREKAMTTLASLAKQGHLKTLDSRINELPKAHKQRHLLRQMALHHMMDGPKKAGAILNLLNPENPNGLSNLQKIVHFKSPDAQRLLFKAVLAGKENSVKGLFQKENFKAFNNLNPQQQVKFAQLTLKSSTFFGDVAKVQKEANDLVGHLTKLKKNGVDSAAGRKDAHSIAEIMGRTPAVFQVLSPQEKRQLTVGLLQRFVRETGNFKTNTENDYRKALTSLKKDNPHSYKAYFGMGAKAIRDGSAALKSFLKQTGAAATAVLASELVATAKMFKRGGSGPIGLVFGTIAGVASSDKKSDMLANGMGSFVSGGLFAASTVGTAGAQLGLAATAGLGALSLVPGVIVGAWALYADSRVRSDRAVKLTNLMKHPTISPD